MDQKPYDSHPRYFKNIITGNVYKFTSGTEGNLHIVNDGVSRFPSDYEPKVLRTHTDHTIWLEVMPDGSNLYANTEME